MIVRIIFYAVGIDIRDRDLDIVNSLKLILDIYLRNARGSCEIKESFIADTTVGIRSGYAGKAVIDPVEMQLSSPFSISSSALNTYIPLLLNTHISPCEFS